MRVSQLTLHTTEPAGADFAALAATQPQLVLAFGAVDALKGAAGALAAAFPQAHRIGCSTAGEISASGVSDGTLVVTALALAKTRVEQVSTELKTMEDSQLAGRRLASGLSRDGLRAILVFGQGVHINGSAMLAGMIEVVGKDIPITGGLAGDGGAFAQTWVLDDQGASCGRIACVGL